MSCRGVTTGWPSAGFSRLRVLSMRFLASACAAALSGTCTAIWSPSKSAPKASQTSGWIWMALPSMSTGMNAWMPRRRGAVQEPRVVLDDVLEDVPPLGVHALDVALRALDVVREAALDELAHDERLEQLERHLLGQPALVELEVVADHDDRAAGVVDALAEEVLAEPALLPAEHVREALQLVVAGPRDGAAAAAVVHEGVDSLLEHALLVPDDDLGRAELEQPLQAVVAVDDPAVEVVQVAGGEAAAVQLHHRAQGGRDDRQGRGRHPPRR